MSLEPDMCICLSMPRSVQSVFESSNRRFVSEECAAEISLEKPADYARPLKTATVLFRSVYVQRLKKKQYPLLRHRPNPIPPSNLTNSLIHTYGYVESQDCFCVLFIPIATCRFSYCNLNPGSSTIEKFGESSSPAVISGTGLNFKMFDNNSV
jgi:hypothetical protein